MVETDVEDAAAPPTVLVVRGKAPEDREEFLRCTSKTAVKHVAIAYDEAELQEHTKRSSFAHDEYFSRLCNQRLGHTLLTAFSLASTQVLLKENFNAFPVGTVMVADEQGAGKGRGGNVWTSPVGCLMFSFTCQVKDGTTLPFLQYVVALSIVQAVQVEAARALSTTFVDSSSLDVVDVRLKWPNDVYGPQGVKIGGVLCESTYCMVEKTFNVTVGCGLNVSNTEPTTCVTDIITARRTQPEAREDGRPTDTDAAMPGREVMLAAIMNTLEANLSTFRREGFPALEAAYLRHWLHTDQIVTLAEPVESASPSARNQTRRIPHTIRGLTASGYLLAEDGDGQRFELHPDGNSLDFFTGLVRKKLPR